MRHAIMLLASTSACLFFVAPLAADDAADRAEIMSVQATFYDSIHARDPAMMERVWVTESYVQAVHPNQPVQQGWKEVAEGWQNLLGIFEEVEVSMPHPQLRTSGDMAWLVGEEAFRAKLTSGEELQERLLATRVFERSDAGWRVVHHHVSILPPAEEQ